MNMPAWKLRLDDILNTARAEVSGRSTAKVAEAPAASPLIKQAADVVEAIKLVTGGTSQLSLADILRKEGAAGTSPGVTETTTRGTQAEAPRSGSGSVTQSPGPKAARPTESAAGTKGASLHDILMQGREAAEKSAGKGGPAETEAGDASGKTPSGLSKLVGSSEAVVDMTKRTALAQTRPSLTALFANVNDSANEAAARAAFPAAVAKGGLKIASDRETAAALQKEAKDREFEALSQAPESRAGKAFHRMGIGFATPEYERNLRETGEFGMKGVGHTLKRITGGAAGGAALGGAAGALHGLTRGGDTKLKALIGAGIGGNLGISAGSALNMHRMARARRDATDKTLREKGFNIEYKDRTFPGATTLLGKKRTSTPPAEKESSASKADEPDFERARSRQQLTYGLLGAASGAADGSPGKALVRGVGGVVSGTMGAHAARSVGQRDAEHGRRSGLKALLLGPEAYASGHAQGSKKESSASLRQAAIAAQQLAAG